MVSSDVYVGNAVYAISTNIKESLYHIHIHDDHGASGCIMGSGAGDLGNAAGIMAMVERVQYRWRLLARHSLYIRKV
jgi:hypothetical protein